MQLIVENTNTLRKALWRYGCIILNIQIQSEFDLLKAMLLKLDHHYFKILSRLVCENWLSMANVITQYYKEYLNINLQILQTSDQHIFVLLFKYVLYLAISLHSNGYFGVLTKLDQKEQNIILQFIQTQVMDKSLKSFKNIENQLKEQLFEIRDSQKCQNLQIELNLIMKEYQELNESYKISQSKLMSVCEQLSDLKQDKFNLMRELELSYSANYLDVIQKYRFQVESYESELQRARRQIEDYKKLVMLKTEQLKQVFEMNQKLRVDFQIAKEEIIVKKCQYTEGIENQRLSLKLEALTLEVSTLKLEISKLKSQIIDKQSKIHQNQKIVEKYNNIKKSHHEFKNLLSKNHKI